MTGRLWTWLRWAFAGRQARAAEEAACHAAAVARQNATLERLRAWERPAWIPSTSSVPDPRALRPDGSWFGGPAGLAPGEAWPECVECRCPMHCFAQLDSRDLPDSVRPFGEGLFQLFYCTEERCGPWEPFAAGHRRRVIRVGLDRLVLTQRPGPGQFPAKAVEGWDAQPDFPSHVELAELEKGPDGRPAELTDDEFAAVYDGPIRLPRDGEKLMGWPDWVQGVEYPSCPQCGQRMSAFLQIDSEQNLPFMFGDCGVGHVCVCPAHSDVFSFAWECC